MQPSGFVEGSSGLPQNVQKTPKGYESDVVYYPGKSVTSGIKAKLRIEQGRIILAQPHEGKLESVIFSVLTQEITSVDRYHTVLGFKTPQGLFKVEFSYKAGIMLGAAAGLAPMGAITAAAGKKTISKSGRDMLERSGYLWWLAVLQKSGVKVKQPKLITYVLIGLFVLLMLLIVLLPR